MRSIVGSVWFGSRRFPNGTSTTTATTVYLFVMINDAGDDDDE